MLGQPCTKLSWGRLMRIAIVEDNLALAQGIAHHLRDQGHAVNLLHDGQTALEFLQQESADIVVMDVNLPRLDGFSILKALRKSSNQLPVLLLTARGDLHDRVTGLDAGADDYLVKPFDMEELDARLRALIRRKPLIDQKSICFGALSFDRAGRKLFAQGQELPLPRRELACSNGKIKSFQKLKSLTIFMASEQISKSAWLRSMCPVCVKSWRLFKFGLRWRGALAI